MTLLEKSFAEEVRKVREECNSKLISGEVVEMKPDPSLLKLNTSVNDLTTKLLSSRGPSNSDI